MCGRYTLSRPEDIVEELGAEVLEAAAAPEEEALAASGQLSLVPLDEAPPRSPVLSPLAPRFNIAPTQMAPIARTEDDGSLVVDLLRWGLIPFWAKDMAIGNRMINARSETAAEKPSFKTSLKRRRCLVLADGFYEWKKTPGGKQPFLIHVAERRPFTMAGLWDRWTQGPEGPVESFTILTTAANERVGEIHDRMPVILDGEAREAWLDTSLEDLGALVALLRPYAAEPMGFYPVSKLVNSPRNDVAECVAAIEL